MKEINDRHVGKIYKKIIYSGRNNKCPIYPYDILVASFLKKIHKLTLQWCIIFLPIRFEKCEKIDTAVGITSIEVNSVVPIKDEKCTYPLV